jgi:putative toxin-antitoxin system antitoxin component (TIGR02293 family)
MTRIEHDAVAASPVFRRALGLFEGDRNATSKWMLSPLPALGGKTPMDAAKTSLGVRQVEDLIGRLEHGVYS